MKKTLFGLVALTALSSASAASYVGLSGGWPVSGIHYQTDTAGGANRFTLGYGFYGGIEGSYERLFDMSNSSMSGGSLNLQPYWGVGASLGVGLSSYYGGLFSVGANGLVGAKMPFTPELSLFGELGVGANFWLGSNSYYTGGFRPAIGGRLGFNYMLK